MNLRHSHRSWFTLVLLILVAALLAGCSKSPAKPKPPPPIPHSDADDIVQQIATTVSANNGGWYCLVKAFAETLSIAAPNIVARGIHPASTRWSVPFSSRLGLRNNFQLTKAGNTYIIQVGYLSGGVPFAERDTSTEDLEALISLDGGQFANANGVTGTYGLHTFALNAAADSTFFVLNLHAGSPDTLEYSGFADDSTFGNVNSPIAHSNRLWYQKNFVDWTFKIPKNKLATPYPVGVESEIHWVIEAKGLKSPGRDDWAFDYIIEAHMIFDGTPDATLSISNVSLDPDWSYLYKVNINTGAFSRID